MPFIANTQSQQQDMLRDIGLNAGDLFADIPQNLRCKKLNLPAGLSEQEVFGEFSRMAGKNNTSLVSFLGGGFYDHYVPAAVNEIISRSEFYTAYTPYQPEIAQGTLQAIYEFQSMICRLTNMQAANASMYDGGTALYEAVMMSMRVTGRRRVILDNSVSVIYRTIIRSYTQNLGIDLIETQPTGGLADKAEISRLLKSGDIAGVIVQNPNFFGCLDDFTELAKTAHENGALLIMSVYPVSLGLVKTPGEMGADIVTGEGQSLGLPLSFGGPYLGFMATRNEYVRKMPGRIAGRTKDRLGRDGFVLTLQAREQHIRREKAMSNICSNEGLCALTATIFLSLYGKDGFADLAKVCADKAAYARDQLSKIPGVQLRFPNVAHFNEFVLELPTRADRVIRRLLREGVAAGFPLARYFKDMENSLLVAVTEKRTKREIDLFAHVLEVSL